MLQSMLYFTTNPLLWLTPFIGYTIDKGDKDTREKQLSLLEFIDNTLSVRQFMDNGLSLQALSWKLLETSNVEYDFQMISKPISKVNWAYISVTTGFRNWNIFYGRK